MDEQGTQEPPQQIVFAAAAHTAPPCVAAGAAPSVVSNDVFEHNWRVFTMGQLDGLDWTNVIAAGGAVLACATTDPPPAEASSAEAAAEVKRRTQLLLSQAGQVDESLSSSPAFMPFHGTESHRPRATLTSFSMALAIRRRRWPKCNQSLLSFGATPQSAEGQSTPRAQPRRGAPTLRLISLRGHGCCCVTVCFFLHHLAVRRIVLLWPRSLLTPYGHRSCVIVSAAARSSPPIPTA